ncbi:MAG: hypothetical protein WBA10_09885 [Elainellaceae cyanobacterium]
MPEPIYSRPFPAAQEHVEDDCLMAAWAAHQFYQEVEQRQAFEDYCQRYYRLAASNQREMELMRDDINLFGWFCRG